MEQKLYELQATMAEVLNAQALNASNQTTGAAAASSTEGTYQPAAEVFEDAQSVTSEGFNIVTGEEE